MDLWLRWICVNSPHVLENSTWYSNGLKALSLVYECVCCDCAHIGLYYTECLTGICLGCVNLGVYWGAGSVYVLMCLCVFA